MNRGDEALAANEVFAQGFTEGHLPAAPARKLAVVTCMDARIHVEELLGLKAGDAHIIRNAGGIVTEDVIRSLIVSHHVLFTQEFLIINHTECGMMAITDEEMRTRLRQVTGTSPVVPSTFFAFADLDENVRVQVEKVKSHPWLPRQIVVRGFVYDVRTGRLREVL
jgi:carbonic anhydrase